MSKIYDLNFQNRQKETISMGFFRNKVVLIVNTATGCEFTPQYEGLEKLYRNYHDQGLEILDFPCNQFGHQAPGSDGEIHAFCTAKYHTSFDQMAKIEVNGENALELYRFLKEKSPTEQNNGIKDKLTLGAIKKLSKSFQNENDIKWNFTKFLVDKSGQIVKRYAPTIEPKIIEADIIKLLEKD